MATTTRERRREDANEEFGDVAPVDLDASAARVERLPELVQSVGATPALLRGELATRINDVLVAMRAPGHEAEESELLVELLTTKVLNELLDTQGRSCRKEAVETLMACGYPHALLLAPEDVEFARTWRLSNEPATAEALAEWETALMGPRRRGAGIMMVGQAVGAVVALLSSLSLAKHVVAGSLSVTAFVLAALIATRRPRDLNIGVVGAALTVTFVAQLVGWGWTGSVGPLLGALSLAIGLYATIGDFSGTAARAVHAPYWGKLGRWSPWTHGDEHLHLPTNDPWGRTSTQWNYGREPTYGEQVPNPKGDFWYRYERMTPG
jgi:hypothetical protein